MFYQLQIWKRITIIKYGNKLKKGTTIKKYVRQETGEVEEKEEWLYRISDSELNRSYCTSKEELFELYVENGVFVEEDGD